MRMLTLEESVRLAAIIDRCKGEVVIWVNQHRTSYMTAREWLSDRAVRFDFEVLSKDVTEGCIDQDSTVQIVFYPETPVGSHSVVHYDLGLAITAAHGILFDSEGP